MEFSAGQKLAISQLNEIASQPGRLFVIERIEPHESKVLLIAHINLVCDGFNRMEGGLPLFAREKFRLFIPANFPFEIPQIEASHNRFAVFPHVQWGRLLCLYQAPASEWDPDQGMFGYLKRLDLFLTVGAIGRFEAANEPIHPPIAYGSSEYAIVVRKNTPVVNKISWVGFAAIKKSGPKFYELVGWNNRPSKEHYAAVFLLPSPLAHEFPTKVGTLLKALRAQSIQLEMFVAHLLHCFKLKPKLDPVFIIIGAPMRGNSADKRKQHLAIWQLQTSTLAYRMLRRISGLLSNDGQAQKIGEDAFADFANWAMSTGADIKWVTVNDDRPEIVCRRDGETSVECFREKSIALWGCGALGSATAEILVRGGVSKLILRDRGVVKAGVLVRQLFDFDDINDFKTSALKKRLTKINPDLKIEERREDVVAYLLENPDWTDGADFIIESTGSNTVLKALEKVRRTSAIRVPIASLAVSRRAQTGIVIFAPTDFTGGPDDLYRKAKIKWLSEAQTHELADDFFPDSEREFFQPEPGCSDPTFIGSLADTFSLCGQFVNEIGRCIKKDDELGRVCTFSQKEEPSVPRRKLIEFELDQTYQVNDGDYEIRIAPSAWKDMLSSINRSKRSNQGDETGGILFGELSESTGVAWVSEICGPPPDSEASPKQFVCGQAGVDKLQDYFRNRYRSSVQYVGMWHTHPNASPTPSRLDLASMNALVVGKGDGPRKPLMLIVGDTPEFPSIFGSVFDRRTSNSSHASAAKLIKSSSDFPNVTKKDKVGLALSGGGARAMAFHLGCLRALHDRGILKNVDVLSTVSGGSVIGAMYAYSSEDFEAFDQRVVSILRKGLQLKAALHLFWPPDLIFNIVRSHLIRILGTVLVLILKPFSFVIKSLRGSIENIDRLVKIRRVSRTDAMSRLFSKELFCDQNLADVKRDLNIIINATDLLTGTVFRFGNSEIGNWRIGSTNEPSKFAVADAVTASAAYPVALPAIYRIFLLTKKSEKVFQNVLLTDGGIYDNLGVTPLLPGRSLNFSTNVFPVDYLICCSAGAGNIANGISSFFFGSRLKRCFEIVFRRVQDQSMAQLHELKLNGKIKGFILPYLGQDDDRLEAPPENLVRRECVVHYPTNFRAIPEADLQNLIKRGEQLTALAISRYCPEL